MNAVAASIPLLMLLGSPAVHRPAARTLLQADDATFEARAGLTVSCGIVSYTHEGPSRAELRLPSNGTVFPTAVHQVATPLLHDNDLCDAVARVAGPTLRPHPITGTTKRRVYDVYRLRGDRCVRLIEETFEIAIDGLRVPLRGSTVFTIGERPAAECTRP